MLWHAHTAHRHVHTRTCTQTHTNTNTHTHTHTYTHALHWTRHIYIKTYLNWANGWGLYISELFCFGRYISDMDYCSIKVFYHSWSSACVCLFTVDFTPLFRSFTYFAIIDVSPITMWKGIHFPRLCKEFQLITLIGSLSSPWQHYFRPQ